MSAPVRGEHLLSLNENPFGPLPSVHRALSDAAGRVNRYPEFLPGRLTKIIARQIGVRPAQLVVGAGITGVVMHILQACVAPGARVVMASPTFDGYPIMTEMIGATCVRVPLTDDGRHNLPAMAAAVDGRTQLVVLCSPHNPTGTVITPSELDSFLHAVDPRVPVILDEAYIEFLADHDRPDSSAIIYRYPNVMVLRTFSKAFGLAALRVGYLVGATELVARVRRWQIPFEVSALAEVGVEASYLAQEELAARVSQITAARDDLAAGLRALGFDVPRTAANCVYLTYREPLDQRMVAAALGHAEISAKYCDTGTRISVGDCADTHAVLAGLAQIAPLSGVL